MKLTLLALALSTFGSQTTLAQISPIEMLDQGSCWLQTMKENDQIFGYKFSSFGSGVAMGLYNDNFSPEGSKMKEWVQLQLKSRFPTLPQLKYEVGFHCYSSGHTVTVQIERPNEQPICINANAKASSNAINDLEMTSLRPDASFSEGYTCTGIEERSLGMSLKKYSEVEIASLRNSIEQSPALSEIIEKIEHSPGSFFAVARLKQAYAFREVEAKAKLEADAGVQVYVSNLWLNSIMTIEGEDRVLFQGSTDAY